MDASSKFLIVKKIIWAILLGLPFFLISLPADYFDDGKSICPSKVLLEIECLGCGLTRAVMHLLHFNFSEAWMYNKLAYPMVVVGVLLWLHILGKFINKPILSFFDKYY